MTKILITGAGDVCNGIIRCILQSNFKFEIFISGTLKGIK